ncbi:hypothetical protein AgCh_001758 [Apium graveolens]
MGRAAFVLAQTNLEALKKLISTKLPRSPHLSSLRVPDAGSLMNLSQNCRNVRRDEKNVPNLVQLLDPSSENTAKKYAVTCLALLSSSKKCKKLMISYGTTGYLKKLTDMDIPSAKKLLERLEIWKLRSLFGNMLEVKNNL